MYENGVREMAQTTVWRLIPLDLVCRDYFRHLTVEKFLRKVLAGEINIPIVRMEASREVGQGSPCC